VRIAVEFASAPHFIVDVGDIDAGEKREIEIVQVAQESGVDANPIAAHVHAVSKGQVEPRPLDRFLVMSRGAEGEERATAYLLGYDRKAKSLNILTAPVTATYAIAPSPNLPERRPKIRLTFPEPSEPTAIKTEADKRDFLSGLKLLFLTLRNNGVEEAFRVRVTLPELRGTRVSLKPIDNLAPGDSVTFEHRHLKYWQGEAQPSTRNFWLFIASLNMFLDPAHPERIRYPLPVTVDYLDAAGREYVSRFSLTRNDHGQSLEFLGDFGT
jgi:hypothetical protein